MKFMLHLNFIYSNVYCVNVVTFCFATITDTVSMTSASCYQSRPAIYMRGLIPRNWPGQFRLCPHKELLLPSKVESEMKLTVCTCSEPIGAVNSNYKCT